MNWFKKALALGAVLISSVSTANPPIIWSGLDSKLLTAHLDFNGNLKILTGSADPTIVAPESAPKGSLYLRYGASGGTFYTKQDAGVSTNWTLQGGSSTVVGPVSSTDNAIARFDGTTGQLIQNSGATIDDSGNITGTSFIGPVTGNASTATALAANPTDCGANTFANTIAANGNLTCAAVNDAALAVSYLKADGTRALTGAWNAGQNITAPAFIGALTGNADTATLASTVTTNANLTGPITSVGNVTSVASQTGTGTTFVMNTSPTLVTPIIGAATGTSLSVSGQLTSTVATGTAPLAVSSTTRVANLNVATAGNADTVTTNANLTGVITSVGNATSIASQTGTGTKFVVDTSPTLVTPVIGAATGTSLSVSGQLTSTASTGTAPLVVSSTTQVANLNAATAGTATNATNGTTVQTSSNASFFPLFVASSSNGNQPFNLGTGITFNPSTNILSTTTFAGALTGTASGNTTYTANNHGVVLSGSGNAMTVVAPNASTAFPLISGGASADPTWAKLSEAGGGTNQTSYTTGDTLYASATNTLSKLAVGTENQVQTIVNGLPAWSGPLGNNYISSNPGAEVGTTGWATYADAAGNVPVDGTGGTATNLTFSRSTSSPIRGVGSFSIAQANSTSLQGKGVSFDFTIDAADQGHPLAVKFNYNASSTFVASNGFTAPLNDGTTTTNAGNSDVEVFIYDKTNAALIPVTPQVITANGSNDFNYVAYFQTVTTSTSYRLIFHVATTSANATGWTFKFDNVFVGPDSTSNGYATIKPTQQKFTSSSGTYTLPTNPVPSYIRVRMIGGGGGGSGSGSAAAGNGGDGTDTTFAGMTAGKGAGAVVGSAGGTAGTASLGSITNGVAITGTAGQDGVGSGSTGIRQLGGAGGTGPFGGANPAAGFNSAGAAGATNTGAGGSGGGNAATLAVISGGGGGSGGYVDAVITNPSATYAYVVGAAGSAGSAGTSGFVGGAGGSGIIIVDEFYAQNDATTGTAREISARAQNSSGTSISASTETIVPFNTVNWDLAGAFTTGSSAKFTAPTSGRYRISAMVNFSSQAWTAGQEVRLSIFKNGVLDSIIGDVLLLTGTHIQPVSGTGDVTLVAGDFVDVRVFQNNASARTLDGVAAENFVVVSRISGPASAAAAESVNFRYFASATSVSGSLATVNWSTKDFDSHNGMSSGTYTVPSSGKYQCNSQLKVAATYSLNNTTILELQKNGTVVSRQTLFAAAATTDLNPELNDLVSAVAGDTLRIQVSSSGTSPSISSSNFENYFSCSRTGM